MSFIDIKVEISFVIDTESSWDCFAPNQIVSIFTSREIHSWLISYRQNEISYSLVHYSMKSIVNHIIWSNKGNQNRINLLMPRNGTESMVCRLLFVENRNGLE